MTPIIQSNTQIIIMRGLPGSGKTTWIDRHIVAHPGTSFVRCSADHFFEKDGEYLFDSRQLDRAHRMCFHHFVEACTITRPDFIYVDNTNSTLWEMAPYWQFGRMYGGKVSFEEMNEWDRAKLAKRNLHQVSYSTIRIMAARWEFLPTYWLDAATGL